VRTVAGGDPEGKQTVTVDLTDLAGNVAPAVPVGEFFTDARPPAIAAVTTNRAVFGPNPDFDRVELAVTPGEAPDGPGAGIAATLGGTPMDCAGFAGGTWVCTYVVHAGDAHGQRPITVLLRDDLGNAASAETSVRFDARAPVVSGLQAGPGLFSQTPGRDLVSANFAVSEPIEGEGALLTVELDGHEMSCSTIGSTHSCTLPVSASPQEGPRTIAIEARDAGGNATTASVPVVFDFTPPHVSASSVSPTAARPGAEIVVVFSSDEALGDAPIATLQRDGGTDTLALEPVAGTQWMFRRAVQETDADAAWNAVVHMTDRAGNEADSTIGSVRVDKSPPVVAVAAVRPARIRGSGVLQVQVSCAEQLPSPPIATVGGRAMSCSAWSAEDEGFLCTRAMTGDEIPEGTEAVQSIAVRVRDSAGNEAIAGDSVVFDFAAPGLLPEPAVPARAKIGDTVVVRLRPTEPLASMPASLVAQPGGAVFLPLAGAPDTFVRTVAEGDPDGNQTVSADLTDAAGNVAHAVVVAVLFTDTHPPVLQAANVVMNRAIFGPNPGFDRVELTATPGEPPDGPDAALSATLGGTPMDCLYSADAWRCAYDVLPGDAHGVRPIVVVLRDDLGNSTIVRTSVEFDVRPPVISAPAAAHDGFFSEVSGRDTVTIGFVLSEPMAGAGSLVSADLDGHAMDCTADGTTESCKLAVSATPQEGARTVHVSARDAGGNVASAALPVTFDFTAPGLSSASVAPVAARAGADIVVSFAADEAIAEAPVATLRHGDDALALSLVPGTQWMFRRAVAATDADAVWEARVHLVDRAGNASDLNIGTATVDKIPPAISIAEVSPARLAAVGELSVRISCGEELPAIPTATVGGRAMTCSAWSETIPGYACTRPMDGDEIADGTESVQSIAVRATDAAGNETLAGGSTVFDFRAPGILAASVGYEAPSNPLGVVSKAKTGTIVRVALVFDEPLDLSEPPVLTASCAGGTLAFDAPEPSSTGALFSTTIPPGFSDGACTPHVRMRDVAGNTNPDATFVEPLLELLTSPAVLSVGQDEIVYLRSPWGNSAAQTLAGYTMPAGPAAQLAPSDAIDGGPMLPAEALSLNRGTPQMVRVWADPAASLLLGSARAQGGAFPRVTLAASGVPVVYATMLDEAANESAPVRVVESEWVATSRPPASGTSPARARAAPDSPPTRDPIAPVAVDAAAGGTDGQAAVARATAAWMQAGPSAALPPVRETYCAAYDSMRGRVVVFGGYSRALSGPLGDTWEWDGTAWTERTPRSGNPPNRSGCAMAFDSVRGRTVLFGGTGAGSFADTWEWDGTAWTQLAPSHSPSPRGQHAMAFDSARGRTVLFGNGFVLPGSNDTWEWDGRDWTQRAPASSPPARSYPAMAYDSVRERVVLFGGTDSSGTALADTWEWDGTTWSPRTSSGATPAARRIAGMAFDSARSRTVLFGGWAMPPSTEYGDTWEWDGQAWTERVPSASGPPARSGALLAYDAARRRTVLFSGYGRWTSGSYVDMPDTREWDGTAWTDRSAGAGVPYARELHAMAFASARGRTVLFGGTGATGACGDTWEWNGAAWSLAASTGPTARSRPALAYDALRDVVVLFGGQSSSIQGDTWEWNGQTWTQRATGGPPARSFHSMAYDSARKRVVLFGGAAPPQWYLNDTWEWDGTQWTPRTPAQSPPGRYNGALAYDAARGRTVLFGGFTTSGYDTRVWEWDGTNWVSRNAPGPSGRTELAMVYDESRGRVQLFGGTGSTTSTADTWEWDGTAWTERTPPAGNPAARYRHAMARDAVRHRTVLFGGRAATGLMADTLEWVSSPDARPAVQFDAAIPADAGFGPAEVTGIAVRAYCGAAFSPYGEADAGAMLRAWTTGGAGMPPGLWLELPGARNEAGAPSQPAGFAGGEAARLEWASASAAEARRFIVERDRQMSFQCRPLGSAGAGEAPAAMDYAEIRVRYRAP